MAKLETFITFQGGAYFEKFWELRFLTSTSFFLGQNNPIERITLKSQTGWWPPLGDLTENFPYNKTNGRLKHQTYLGDVFYIGEILCEITQKNGKMTPPRLRFKRNSLYRVV